VEKEGGGEQEKERKRRKKRKGRSHIVDGVKHGGMGLGEGGNEIRAVQNRKDMEQGQTAELTTSGAQREPNPSKD